VITSYNRDPVRRRGLAERVRAYQIDFGCLDPGSLRLTNTESTRQHTTVVSLVKRSGGAAVAAFYDRSTAADFMGETRSSTLGRRHCLPSTLPARPQRPRRMTSTWTPYSPHSISGIVTDHDLDGREHRSVAHVRRAMLAPYGAPIVPTAYALGDAADLAYASTTSNDLCQCARQRRTAAFAQLTTDTPVNSIRRHDSIL